MTTPWQDALMQINKSKLSISTEMKLAHLPITEDPDDMRFQIGFITSAHMPRDGQDGLQDRMGRRIPGLTVRSTSGGAVYTAIASLRGLAALSNDDRVITVSTSQFSGPSPSPSASTPKGP